MPDKAICVLVCTAFSGMIGSGRVALYRIRLLHFLVAMEFCPVIERDGQETLSMLPDSLDTGLGSFSCCSGIHFLDDHKASGALNQGNDTMMPVVSDDSIPLLVADFTT
jgi:hypothetical protein